MDLRKIIDFIIANIKYFDVKEIQFFLNWDFTKLIKSFNQKYKESNDPHYKAKLVDLLFQIQKFAKAYEKEAYKFNYNKATEKNHFLYWFNFYLDLGLLDEAKKVLDDIRAKIDDVNFYRKLVRKYEQRKQTFEKEKESTLKKIEYENRMQYIDYLIWRGDFDAALSEVMTLLSEYPNDKKLHQYLSKIDQYKSSKEISDVKFSEEIAEKIMYLQNVKQQGKLDKKEIDNMIRMVEKFIRSKDYEGWLSFLQHIEEKLKIEDKRLLKLRAKLVELRRKELEKRQREAFKLEMNTLNFYIKSWHYDEALRKAYNILKRYPLAPKKQLLKIIDSIQKKKILQAKQGQKGDWFEEFMMKFAKFNKNGLYQFYEKMAWFLKGKMHLKFALDVVYAQAKDLGLKKFVRDLKNGIENGAKLSEIMALYMPPITKLDTAMVRIAESTWKLWEIFNNIYLAYKEEDDRKKKIRGVMMYPIVVITITIGIFVGLLIFIVPKFVGFYEQVGVDLPFITQMLINLSNFIMEKWYIMIIEIIVFVVLLKMFGRTEMGKRTFGRLSLNFPVVKEISRRKYIVMFTGNLSLLLKAGLNILDAMNLIIDGTDNPQFADEFKRIRFELETGANFAQILGLSKQGDIKNYKNEYIPIDVAYAIDIWEKTWQLAKLLGDVAERYNEDLKLIIKNLQSLMEPLIIVLIWWVVFMFVMAIFLPMIHIYNVIGKMWGV